MENFQCTAAVEIDVSQIWQLSLSSENREGRKREARGDVEFSRIDFPEEVGSLDKLFLASAIDA
jgi:hypothetical protein